MYDQCESTRCVHFAGKQFANCFPAKWTQRVDSHWSYMGALSTVNDNNITVDRFALKGNYPNPFNPTTKIRFTNDRNSNVKVTVYALNGAPFRA